MTATIIDGKETAKEKREQLAKEVEELKQKGVTAWSCRYSNR